METSLDKLINIFTQFIESEIPQLNCLVNFEANSNFFNPKEMPHSISLASFFDRKNFKANKYETTVNIVKESNWKWPQFDAESEDQHDLVLDYLSRMVFAVKNK